MNSEAPSTSAAPRGVEHAGVIDLLTHEESPNRVTLVMVEARPWDGSELRLFQLQEKINAYLSFALDGEMGEIYPQLVGVPLRLLLECATYPDEPAIELLTKVREQIALQEIEFEVLVKEGSRPAGSCGTSCGCS